MHCAAGAASGTSGADKPQAEEKAEFNIKLTGFDAASKIRLIKEVRSIMNLGLKEAKETVSNDANDFFFIYEPCCLAN